MQNRYKFVGGKLEHRDKMEKKLGRKLKRSEIVHHIDGDPTNNDIDNLQLCPSIAAHLAIHHATISSPGNGRSRGRLHASRAFISARGPDFGAR